MLFKLVPGVFSQYLINWNNTNSNCKKILGFRNIQEKLENSKVFLMKELYELGRRFLTQDFSTLSTQNVMSSLEILTSESFWHVKQRRPLHAHWPLLYYFTHSEAIFDKAIGIILLQLIYSEKATKFCKILTILLSYAVAVKSKMKILRNFVAFSVGCPTTYSCHVDSV